jgi:hypothetical protein
MSQAAGARVDRVNSRDATVLSKVLHKHVNQTVGESTLDQAEIRLEDLPATSS